jgi:aspartate kinase
MKVFKFGGASVKDAEGVKNMTSIVMSYSGKIIIVISAMGKTTNALEKVVKSYFSHQKNDLIRAVEDVKNYHYSIFMDLFKTDETNCVSELDDLFNSFHKRVYDTEPSLDFDFEYDQIVSYGELFSSKIVSLYLQKTGYRHKWIDIRECLRTDDTWREGNIDWEISRQLVPKVFNNFESLVYLTQGFIASTSFNSTITLGREGSDYSAAILANIMDAESLTIWKDVPGIMTADPHKFSATRKMEQLSYREAVEMTYFGAKIIHPKTMKPLVDKNIPLFVKSFFSPQDDGSIVHNFDFIEENIPVIILKENQLLITVSSLDLSFIAEDHIAKVYHLLSQHRIKVNLVQQSAMSLSFAIDKPEKNIDRLIQEMHQNFRVRYNDNLELLTVRNYDSETISNLTKNKMVFVEQRTRRTARFLVK